MTPAEKRQERRRREDDLLRESLNEAIDATDRQIDALASQLRTLEAVRAAVLPGILKTLEDFYRGAVFAAQNQFDGDINRIEARLVRLHKEASANRAARDALGGDQ